MSTSVEVVNYDVDKRIESSSPRTNGDSNRFGPAGVSLPHDICRSYAWTQTYIYQPLLRSSKTWTGPALLKEHSTPLFHATKVDNTAWVHITLTISTLPVRGCRFNLNINRSLGLLEYVASTHKVSTHTRLQRYGPQSAQAGSLC
jgi:hypothetical protein